MLLKSPPAIERRLRPSAVRAEDFVDDVRTKLTTLFLLTISLLMVSAPLFAHHGSAGYEYDKTITVKGTVTAWIWSNPHCFLKFDAKNEKGKLEHWVVEAGSQPDMLHVGWSSTTFKPGDEVTVDVMPTKNGVHVGKIRRVVLANGTVLGCGNSTRPCV